MRPLDIHELSRRALGPALLALALIGSAAAQAVPGPDAAGAAPAGITITVRTGAGGPAADLCSFDGFHVDVVLPPDTARAAGDTITVTLRSEGTGEEVTLELTSTGAARGPVTYTNADPVTLARGAAWSSIGPLPLWTMYPLETANEDTLTIVYDDASTELTVYDTPWQRELARLRELGTALRDFYARALAATGSISAESIAACHAKLAAAKNLLAILDREDLNDVRKVRLGEAYVDLLGSDPSGWSRAESPDARLGYLGIVFGSEQEAAGVEGALDRAREDIRGFRDAAIGHVVDGVYDVVTNVTGANQASMVFLGTDARGRRVAVWERFLAGIDLGSRAILLGASMTNPAGGGGMSAPRPGAGAGGRRPVVRAPEAGGVPPAGPRRAPGASAGAPGAPRAGAAPRRGDTDAGALRRPEGEASTAPPPPARGLAEGTPEDLANFGLPDRPWARDVLAGARRDLRSADAAVSARGKDRLLKFFSVGKELQASLAPEFLGRLDAALAIVERIVAHPEFRGAFRWDDAWFHLLLHAERQRGIAPSLAVEAVIASRTPSNLLTLKMVQDATGLGRAAAGALIRRAAERLGLDDAGLRRLGVEVPELPRGLFRPGDAARSDPPPSFGYGGVAPGSGTSSAILPAAGLAAGGALAARADDGGNAGNGGDGRGADRAAAPAAALPQPGRAPAAPPAAIAMVSPGAGAPPGAASLAMSPLGPPAMSVPNLPGTTSGLAVPPFPGVFGPPPSGGPGPAGGLVLPGSTAVAGGPGVILPTTPGGLTRPVFPTSLSLPGGGGGLAPPVPALPAPNAALAVPGLVAPRTPGVPVRPLAPGPAPANPAGLPVPPAGASAGTVGGLR